MVADQLKFYMYAQCTFVVKSSDTQIKYLTRNTKRYF